MEVSDALTTSELPIEEQFMPTLDSSSPATSDNELGMSLLCVPTFSLTSQVLGRVLW